MELGPEKMAAHSVASSIMDRALKEVEESLKDLFRYASVSNAGGLVACVTLFGDGVQGYQTSFVILIAFFAFSVGLVSSGLIPIFRFMAAGKTIQQIGGIELEDLNKESIKQNMLNRDELKKLFVTLTISLGAFVTGLVAGLIELLMRASI